MIAMKILITCHALFITASVIGQNVGIGNANPVTKLDVSGSADSALPAEESLQSGGAAESVELSETTLER